MVRNLIRNQAPGNRLRVRIPCPPLIGSMISLVFPLITNVLLGEASCACDSLQLRNVSQPKRYIPVGNTGDAIRQERLYRKTNRLRNLQRTLAYTQHSSISQQCSVC